MTKLRELNAKSAYLTSKSSELHPFIFHHPWYEKKKHFSWVQWKSSFSSVKCLLEPAALRRIARLKDLIVNVIPLAPTCLQYDMWLCCQLKSRSTCLRCVAQLGTTSMSTETIQFFLNWLLSIRRVDTPWNQ